MSYNEQTNVIAGLDGKLYKLTDSLLGIDMAILTNSSGYTPQSCLLKDPQTGEIYSILDLLKGIKVPLSNADIKGYSYTPRSGTARDYDGTVVDLIEAYFQAGKGSGGGGGTGIAWIPYFNPDNKLAWKSYASGDTPPSPTNVHGTSIRAKGRIISYQALLDLKPGERTIGDAYVIDLNDTHGFAGHLFVCVEDIQPAGMPDCWQDMGKIIGVDGNTWKPTVDSSGNLTWSITTDSTPPSSVNIKGEKGDIGNTGQKGDKGDQGIQGEKGLQGEQGIKGDKGDRGEQGIPGEKGESGTPGPQGNQGEKGDKGDKGDQGLKGDVGQTGARGENGVSLNYRGYMTGQELLTYIQTPGNPLQFNDTFYVTEDYINPSTITFLANCLYVFSDPSALLLKDRWRKIGTLGFNFRGTMSYEQLKSYWTNNKDKIENGYWYFIEKSIETKWDKKFVIYYHNTVNTDFDSQFRTTGIINGGSGGDSNVFVDTLENLINTGRQGQKWFVTDIGNPTGTISNPLLYKNCLVEVLQDQIGTYVENSLKIVKSWSTYVSDTLLSADTSTHIPFYIQRTNDNSGAAGKAERHCYGWVFDDQIVDGEVAGKRFRPLSVESKNVIVTKKTNARTQTEHYELDYVLKYFNDEIVQLQQGGVGEKGDSIIPMGFCTKATFDAMVSKPEERVSNEMWILDDDTSALDGCMYVWDIKNKRFVNMGLVKGKQGIQGIPGVEGAEGPEGQPGVQGEKGEKGDPGEKGGSVHIKGTVKDQSELPIPPTNEDDAYIIGLNLWVWDATNKKWIDVGQIKGPAGAPGERGPAGPRGHQGARGPSGTVDSLVLSFMVSAAVSSAMSAVTSEIMSEVNAAINAGIDAAVTAAENAATAAVEKAINDAMDQIKGEKGDKGDQGDKGDKGDTGAACQIIDHLDNTSLLPIGSEEYVGKGYLIGDNEDLYMCTKDFLGVYTWKKVGNLRGPAGKDADWIISLKDKDMVEKPNGSIDVEPVAPGVANLFIKDGNGVNMTPIMGDTKAVGFTVGLENPIPEISEQTKGKVLSNDGTQPTWVDAPTGGNGQVVLQSPDGTLYIVEVGNQGRLSTRRLTEAMQINVPTLESPDGSKFTLLVDNDGRLITSK